MKVDSFERELTFFAYICQSAAVNTLDCIIHIISGRYRE
jgi:hypothetical protein